MPTTQLAGPIPEYPSSNNTASGNGTVPVIVPRSAFNPTTTTLGYFIAQDSYYGNSFIPVLPRFDSPTSNHLHNKN